MDIVFVVPSLELFLHWELLTYGSVLVVELTTGVHQHVQKKINNLKHYLPAEEVNVEEDVLAIVKAKICRLDHDLAHRVWRGTKYDN